MARYYQTANAPQQDYMYALNTPLMQQVIAANDAYITDELGQTEQQGQLANFAHLSQDEDAAKAITAKYSDRADAIVSAIKQDPANWRKQQNNLAGLKKDILNDYTTGAISKYTGNYDKRKQAFDAVDKQVELWNTSGGTKGVSPDRAQAYKNHWDESFTGTNYNPLNPSTYNTYKGGSVMDNIDVAKKLEDGLDKIKADKSLQYKEDANGQGYIIGKEGSYEAITPQKILEVSMGNLTPEVMSYLSSDAQVGLIKKDSLTSPYSLSAVDIAPDEQKNIDYLQDKINKSKGQIKQQIESQLANYKSSLASRTKINWDDNSYFSPILKKLMNQYSYSATTEKDSLKPDTTWGTKFTQGQENSRQAKSLGQAWQIHLDTKQDALDKAKQDQSNWDKEFAEKQYEFRNPQSKLGIGKTGLPNKTTKQPIIKFPEQTGVSKESTRSFQDWNTQDTKSGASVPVLSNVGLSSDIDTYKKTIDVLNQNINAIDKQLADKNLPDNQRQVLLQSKNKLASTLQFSKQELADRREFYNTSVQAVLSDNPKAGTPLSKSDKETYNEFSNDRDAVKFNKYIEDLRKQYPDIEVGQKHRTGSDWDKYAETSFTEESPQVKQAKDKLQNYLDVKKRFDSNRDTWLSSLRGDIIGSDAIELNSKDSKDVSDVILQNPRGSQIFDDIGHSTNGIVLKKNYFGGTYGDSKQMTFDNGDLQSYMQRNNVQMHVLKVAPTTKIGNGNSVAEVVFEDPTGGISSGTHYYISLNNALQNTLGNKFRQYPQQGVADIASDMTDVEANNIKNQLFRPSTKNALGNTSPTEPYTHTINVPYKGAILPLNVTTFVDGDQRHYNITYTTKDGQIKPFPRADTQDSSKQGWFGNEKDFINQYKYQR